MKSSDLLKALGDVDERYRLEVLNGESAQNALQVGAVMQAEAAEPWKNVQKEKRENGHDKFAPLHIVMTVGATAACLMLSVGLVQKFRAGIAEHHQESSLSVVVTDESTMPALTTTESTSESAQTTETTATILSAVVTTTAAADSTAEVTETSSVMPEETTQLVTEVPLDVSVTTTDTVTTPYENFMNVYIVEKPLKTTYSIGAPLMLTGCKARAIGRINGRDYDTDVQQFSYFEVDTSAYDNTREGTYPIYVRYLGGEACFYVHVTADGIPLATETTQPIRNTASMQLKSAPYKTLYVFGQELDLRGCVISEYDGSGAWLGDFRVTDYEIDDSEFDSTKAGIYTIYVKKGELSVSFTVTMIP